MKTHGGNDHTNRSDTAKDLDPSDQINSCNLFFQVFTFRAELTKNYEVGGLNASDDPCDSIQLW